MCGNMRQYAPTDLGNLTHVLNMFKTCAGERVELPMRECACDYARRRGHSVSVRVYNGGVREHYGSILGDVWVCVGEV